MRFKLTENRIDDLKKLITRDLNYKSEFNHEIIELAKYFPDFEKYDVRSISLLSELEVEKLDQKILKWPHHLQGTYWLRDPSDDDDLVSCVYYDYYDGGSSFVGDDYYNLHGPNIHYVRPVLYLNYYNLNLNETYKFCNQPWIAISKDCLLYDGDFGIYHIFDEKSNDYDKSDIKKIYSFNRVLEIAL